MAAFQDDQRAVLAKPGSNFYHEVCGEDWDPEQPCKGTVDEYINVFFGGRFERSHFWYDIMAMAIFLVSARLMTFFALKYFNYIGS